MRMPPNKPAYHDLERSYIWDREQTLTYKYEELIKTNLPKLGNLFVLRFCLLQIKLPDKRIGLIILTVVVLTVGSWTLITLQFGTRIACRCIMLLTSNLSG